LPIEKFKYDYDIFTKIIEDTYNINIILPNRYRLVYSGIECDCDCIGSLNENLNIDYINEESFENKIMVVNFDSQPLNINEISQIEEAISNPEDYNLDRIKEIFYRIIKNCEYILIKFSEDKKVSDITIYFRYISPESFEYSIGNIEYNKVLSILE